MIKIFLDAATYIKIFASSFSGLAAITTGGFYYVGSQLSKSSEEALLQLDKQKEVLLEQQRQLEKLRTITIP